MQPSIDHQAATKAFVAAIRAPADVQPPSAEIARLCADMNDKARMFSAWVPETTEGAAAKLKHAAKAINEGALAADTDAADADALATMAKGIASDLDSGEPVPALTDRLGELLAYFDCFVADGSGAIEHIRTALKGLTTPRAVN